MRFALAQDTTPPSLHDPSTACQGGPVNKEGETMSTTGLSRRDFFKGAAAGTMGVAALGALGGCAPSTSKGTETVASETSQAGTYDVMAELST